VVGDVVKCYKGMVISERIRDVVLRSADEARGDASGVLCEKRIPLRCNARCYDCIDGYSGRQESRINDERNGE